MPKYTQTFASLASQFKTQDDGVNFTITVDANNRKQAARRLAILLYGRCAVASSTLQPASGPIAIIGLEIQWCRENKGSSGCDPSFERGFVAGLKQARRLLKAATPKLGPMQIKSLTPSNPTKNRRITCTCRGGNSGCAMHGHSDR
jgi:hypothetical protein